MLRQVVAPVVLALVSTGAAAQNCPGDTLIASDFATRTLVASRLVGNGVGHADGPAGELCYAAADREAVSRALFESSKASGQSAQFSIGERLVALEALAAFNRASIGYTADINQSETIVYVAPEAAPAVAVIVESIIAAGIGD